jgi:hypothetical protein
MTEHHEPTARDRFPFDEAGKRGTFTGDGRELDRLKRIGTMTPEELAACGLDAQGSPLDALTPEEEDRLARRILEILQAQAAEPT